MPPVARIRPIIEQMIHDGATPKQIAAHAEDIGVSPDYALSVYRGLTSVATQGGAYMPTREDHHKHLRAVLLAMLDSKAKGKPEGFAAVSDEVVANWSVSETAPPRAAAFWRPA